MNLVTKLFGSKSRNVRKPAKRRVLRVEQLEARQMLTGLPLITTIRTPMNPQVQPNAAYNVVVACISATLSIDGVKYADMDSSLPVRITSGWPSALGNMPTITLVANPYNPDGPTGSYDIYFSGYTTSAAVCKTFPVSIQCGNNTPGSGYDDFSVSMTTNIICTGPEGNPVLADPDEVINGILNANALSIAVPSGGHMTFSGGDTITNTYANLVETDVEPPSYTALSDNSALAFQLYQTWEMTIQPNAKVVFSNSQLNSYCYGMLTVDGELDFNTSDGTAYGFVLGPQSQSGAVSNGFLNMNQGSHFTLKALMGDWGCVKVKDPTTFENQGTLDIGDGGVFDVVDGILLNDAGSTVEVCDGGILINESASTVTNDGSLTLDANQAYGGGIFNDAGTFVNAGTITDNGTLCYDGTSTQTLTPGISGTGNLTVSSSAILDLAGNTATLGTVTIDGTVEDSSDGNGSLTSGGFTLAGATVNATLYDSTGTDTVSGTIALDDPTCNSLLNNLSIPSACTVDINGGTATLGGDTVNNGTLAVGNGGQFYNGGTFTNNKTITIANGGNFYNGPNLADTVGGTFYNDGRIYNDGWLQNEGYRSCFSTLSNAGTLINYSDGTFYNGVSADYTGNGSVSNSGAFLVYGQSSMINANGEITNNSGGTFTISGSGTEFQNESSFGFSNNGTINVTSGAIFQLTSGSLTNAGTFDVTASTLNVESGNTLNNSGAIALATDAVFNNYGTVDNTGSVTCPSGCTVYSPGTWEGNNWVA